MIRVQLLTSVALGLLCIGNLTRAADDRLVFAPHAPNGRHVVLIAGDEEYRSEETMPMLGKLLARHGFRCTVLFSFGPHGADYIDPNHQAGLRGIAVLQRADLVILGTRFRRPDKSAAAHITEYLEAGKPWIGLRTATHAFRGDETFGGTLKYSDFGLKILGEQWVRHHGQHQVQGTRSVVEPAGAAHPILQGVGEIFAPTDVYGVEHLTRNDRILLRAAVTESLQPSSPNVQGEQNDPLQPLAWLHPYVSPSGTARGTSFCTTAGASVDFVDPDLRRLVVNACFFLTGQKVPAQADVQFVDPFYPSFYGFIRDADYWRRADKRPADYALSTSSHMPDPPGSPSWDFRPRPPFPLSVGQRVALVGNSLAERMSLFGHLETLLHLAGPEKRLVVRNFGWPADEVGRQQRPTDYTKLDDPLAVFAPNLFICCFGFNESFRGDSPEVIDQFIADYRAYIADKVQRFARAGKEVRFVLVSPIAFEATGQRLQPPGDEENRRLARYTRAIAHLAADDGHWFVNVFDDTLALFNEQPGAQFTINGIHLNDAGDRGLAQLLYRKLFGAAPAAPSDQSASYAQVRAAVIDKAWHHQQDYRMLNGWYVYGGRRTWDTETFPSEYAKIRRMVATRDQYVWDLAAGRPVPDQPDDSQTGAVVVPPTMFGTRDEQFRAGREPTTLEYPTPAESMAQMSVPEGFAVELFASEREFPALANPSQLAFDDRGRLWVACMANYPQWSPAGAKPDDRLLILEDTDGDGRADRSQVFYDQLICPTGFEFFGGGVLVVDQPRILFLKDTDGDDCADQVTCWLDGFASDDTHHAIGAWEYSAGGLLHMLEGISMSTTLETPWGPFRGQGPSGTYVLDPLSMQVRYFRTPGHGNPWCLVFDEWGMGIVGDGTGGQQHWTSPLSGADVSNRRTLRTIFDNEGMRPAVGSEFLTSSHFPSAVHGQFTYGCVINMHGLPRFTVADEQQGAGFTGQRIADLLASEDKFFRPVDPKIGPDGALWFADWCNPLIGHMQYSQRDPHRDHAHGRIYRLVYPARPLNPVVTQHGKSTDELLDQLTAFEPRTRYRARRALRDHPAEEVLSAVSRWVQQTDDPQHWCEALWVQEGCRRLDRALVDRLLTADNFRARAAAVHAVANEHQRLPGADQLLRTAVHDPHPRVRLEALRGLSFLDSSAAAAAALEVTTHPLDEWLEYTLEHTLKALLPHTQDPSFLADAAPAIQQRFEQFKLSTQPGAAAIRPLAVAQNPAATAAAREQAIGNLAQLGGGDQRRGQQVFSRVCATCHQVDETGKAFGPRLDGLARRMTKTDMVRSTLWPNHEIATGYETLQIETEAGKSYSGLLLSETDDELTMGVAEGRVVTIAKQQIELREPKPNSSMPTGLANTMAPIELLDLIAYLQRLDQLPRTGLGPQWIETQAADTGALRQKNGFVEISRQARLQLEPNFPARYNQSAGLLLSAGTEQQHDDFVIHSPDYYSPAPLIVVRLPQCQTVRHIWLQNRTSTQFIDRAEGLTVWLSTGGASWRKVWQAAATGPEWDVPLPPQTTAQYVKVGLDRDGILHLNRMVVYGQPD